MRGKTHHFLNMSGDVHVPTHVNYIVLEGFEIVLLLFCNDQKKKKNALNVDWSRLADNWSA